MVATARPEYAIDRMSHASRLRAFFRVATAGDRVGRVSIPDPSCGRNQKRAWMWMDDALGFLSSQDRNDLVEVWQYAVQDARNVPLFYRTVISLASKYDEPSKSARRTRASVS